MYAAHSMKLSLLLMSMHFALASCSNIGKVEVGDDDLSWEDFDVAVSEEDCFGDECGRSSGALHLLQKSYKVKKAWRGQQDKEAYDDWSQEEANADLATALESDDSSVEALSLVQTDAAVERKHVSSEHEHVAVLPDGSFEMNPHQIEIPKNGMMAISVDGHGDLHQEDRVAMVQTTVDVTKKRNNPEASASLEEDRENDANLADAIESEGATTEGLSLVQTDATAHEAMSGAVLPDGSFEIHPHRAVFSVGKMMNPRHDGKMIFSVDSHGDLHAEDASSFMQTEASIENPDSDETTSSVDGSDADIATALDADASATEGLSLVQTDASAEHSSSPQSQHASYAVLPDGSFERNPHITEIPKDGHMFFSVDGHGDLHAEDTMSMMQAEVSSESEDGLSNEELFDALEAEEPAPAAALSLVQTDAHLERKSIPESTDGAVHVPETGVMHLSVDARGAFHIEK